MEFNVDKQIKDFWNKFIGLTDTNNEEFADATSENSVRASKFLEGLNLVTIMFLIFTIEETATKESIAI